MEKKCQKCLNIKPLNMFVKCVVSKDGRRKICLKCRNEMDQNNPIRVMKHRITKANFSRRQRALNPGIKLKQIQEWRKKYPERNRAHSLVSIAVKKGKLKREKCRDCERMDTHGHHPDYSKPLEVIWLCPIHHQHEHQKIKGRKLRKNKK